MDINWTTFFFEIANFLILVWIVWRFLYRPVREILDRRAEAIAAEIAKADATRAEADQVKERYESRLKEWQSEKEAALRKLDEELGREREARLEALGKQIEERTAAARSLEERHLAELRDEAERTGAAHGARLASRLLSLAATPELERRLVDMVVDDLSAPPENGQEGPQAGTGDGPLAVNVVSAFEIDAERCAALERALTGRLGEQLSFRYDRDPEMIAGVRVSVGAFEWGANLRDELQSFADSANAGH